MKNVKVRVDWSSPAGKIPPSDRCLGIDDSLWHHIQKHLTAGFIDFKNDSGYELYTFANAADAEIFKRMIEEMQPPYMVPGTDIVAWVPVVTILTGD